MKDTDKGYRQFLDDFRAMAEGKHVVIGIRGEKGAERYPAEGEEAAPLTLVEVGAVNEFGTEDGHIPSRPFLRGTFDTHRAKYETRFTSGLRKVLDGKATLDEVLGELGVRVTGDVQAAISKGIAPENAPATIKAKGSEKPLIHHGRLRQSIDHEIRAKKGA